MNNDQETKTKATILTPQEITIIIPECCRLGLPTCKHVAQKDRKSKSNVGM